VPDESGSISSLTPGGAQHLYHTRHCRAATARIKPSASRCPYIRAPKSWCCHESFISLLIVGVAWRGSTATSPFRTGRHCLGKRMPTGVTPRLYGEDRRPAVWNDCWEAQTDSCGGLPSRGQLGVRLLSAVTLCREKGTAVGM